MATIFALVSPVLLIFTIHFTLAIAITAKSFTSPPKGLVTKLIHHDSILSPFYNPNDTAADCIKEIMRISSARLAYLYAKTGRASVIDNSYLNLVPYVKESMFLVNFSIGQPPIPQLAVMDTGSSLLWVQCAPYQGYLQESNPILDPSKSSTYANLSCNNTMCSHAPRWKCNSQNECTYSQTYANGAPSAGIIATEQLTFEDPEEGTNVVHDIVFGCSYDNGNIQDKCISGVPGLGNDITSLAIQMGSKFSYCLGSIFDPYHSYNQLALGDETIIEGDATPLELCGGQYFITMEGISVGEKGLDFHFDPITTTGREKGKQVMIDSGTGPTWLAGNEYTALYNEVHNILDGFLTRFLHPSYLCYNGRVTQDLIGFPSVTFHFAVGADLVLDTQSMFYQAQPNIFCMTVKQNRYLTDLSIIGLLAQQYYNIAYDLAAKKLFFQRIDCELLNE